MCVGRALLLLALSACIMQPRGTDAQLIANIKNFLSNLPTFGSANVPTFSVTGKRLNVQVPAPANVSFGTVDPQTGTWEYKDKALGAGVEGASDFQQAARLGPDGLVLGPNKAGDLKDRTLSPYDPTIDLRLQNVKLGPDGLQINAGSKTNSTVQISDKGLQLTGNPTGSGESHVFVKPNFNLLGQQVVGTPGQTPAPPNVQFSAGDGQKTAAEQLQGYTNYQLDPSKGTYTKLDANSAPPFMGVDPNGRPYTSPAQAPGPGGASAPRMAASQAAAAQQGKLLSTDQALAAAAAPGMASAAATAAATPLAAAPAAPNYQVVDKPNPRQTLYGRDLYNGTPESVQAYKEQVLDRNKGGSSASQSAGGAAQAGAQATPSLADALASQLSAAAAGQGPAPAPQAAPTDESAGGNAPPSDWVDGQPTSPDTGLSAAPEPAPAPAPAAQLPPAIAPAPAQAMAPAYARQTAAPITPAAAVRPMPELPLAPGAWAPGEASAAWLGSLDVDSFKKKHKNKHHKSATPPPGSATPPASHKPKHKKSTPPPTGSASPKAAVQPHEAATATSRAQQSLQLAARLAALEQGNAAEIIGDTAMAAPVGAPVAAASAEAIIAAAKAAAAAPAQALPTSATLNQAKAGRRLLRSL